MADKRTDSEPASSSALGPDEDHSGRRVWWIIVAVGFVVFIGLIMLGRPLVEGRLAAARNLDRATEMIAGTAGELAAIDATVRAASATGTTAPVGKALTDVTGTRTTLKEASRLSQTGYDRLTEDEQRRATIVRAMAIARIEALDAAEAVLSARADGAAAGETDVQALKDYDRAVEKVREADAALGKL